MTMPSHVFASTLTPLQAVAVAVLLRQQFVRDWSAALDWDRPRPASRSGPERGRGDPRLVPRGLRRMTGLSWE